MNTEESTISSTDLDKKTVWFAALCREKGLKVTPQRIAIYRELVKTNEHPSAEMLCEKVRRTFPSISLGTPRLSQHLTSPTLRDVPLLLDVLDRSSPLRRAQ